MIVTVTVPIRRSRGPESLKVYLERLDAEAVLDRLLRKLSPRETEVVRIGWNSLFFSERLGHDLDLVNVDLVTPGNASLLGTKFPRSSEELGAPVGGCHDETCWGDPWVRLAHG